MKMTENYKIIGSFIKDMSSETPDTPTHIFVRDKISNNFIIFCHFHPLYLQIHH